MLWGGFTITADIDTGHEGAEGVVFALGDWFGGYALYLVGGRAHFTFARAADTLELAMPSALAAGRHTLAVIYSVGEGEAAGRMVLLVDGVEVVDDIPVEGMLPLAVQHGGAGLRLGWDSGFPGVFALRAAGALQGTVHAVQVDTPGSAPAGPDRRSARRSARRLMRRRRSAFSRRRSLNGQTGQLAQLLEAP